MKRLFPILLFIIPVCIKAGGLGGETEIGSDGKGHGFFSQYLLYDWKKGNVLTRYFKVNGILERGEFALGPTINLNDNDKLKLQFGGTTDREIMLAYVLIDRLKGHDIIHIFDAKLATREEGANELYQKFFFAINKSGKWQIRIEDLQVGDKQSFLRLGIEYQQKIPDGAHIFIAPFYDPIHKSLGGQFGLRFF